jgi:hypothetical protein
MHRCNPLTLCPTSAARVLALLLLLVRPCPTCATPLSWTDDDWSYGHHSSLTGVDPDVCPGLLVLNNNLHDLRYLAGPTQFQGLYSMAVYHDTLFVTASDYPFMYDGADVIAYDYLQGTFDVVYQPYESGLHIIKLFGDTLYLPGPDSMDPWETPGSIYTYDGHLWREKATLPTAVHVCDVEVAGQTVYATTGHCTGELNGMGCVWMSRDWGDTFTRVLSIRPTPDRPWRRMFGLGHIGNRVFAQPDGFPPETNVIYSSINGTDWDTLPVPNFPVDRQAMFTIWNNTLLMTIENRMYLWNGTTWRERYLPFHGWRWCRGIQCYKGNLYGGGNTCRLFHWLGESQWESIGSLNVDSTTTEIESMASYYGRLYLSTSRLEQGQGMLPGIYVSASLTSGTMNSLVHDFGVQTAGGIISFDQFRPSPEDHAILQLRSGLTEAQLATRPFIGPDGTIYTYYEGPGTLLASIHTGDRYFQFRVELHCPQGLRMPILRSVTLRVDSLGAPSGISEEEAAETIAGARSHWQVGAAYPNPAQNEVSLPLRLVRPDAPEHSVRLATARAQITDVTGRVLRSETIRLEAPGRDWRWDLNDNHGRPVPSGTYWIGVRIEGDNAGETVRAIRVLR